MISLACNCIWDCKHEWCGCIYHQKGAKTTRDKSNNPPWWCPKCRHYQDHELGCQG